MALNLHIVMSDEPRPRSITRPAAMRSCHRSVCMRIVAAEGATNPSAPSPHVIALTN